MRKLVLLSFIICYTQASKAQIKGPGQFSGSFESYTQVYQKDSAINAIVPQDKVGSNNYLKLDYTNGPFSAGVQFESYLPSIAGFPFYVNKSALINRYFRYTKNRFAVQVGDFYEQFGSGLVFRTWENRQIGINNALEGANVQVQPLNFIRMKAMYGRMRKVLDYTNSNVRGIDAEFDLAALSKKPEGPSIRVTPGFSYVSRYQEYTGPDESFPATVAAYSGRLQVEGSSASTSFEYVSKGKDPHDVNLYNMNEGRAFLWSSALTIENLGINLTLRELNNMDYRSEREAIGLNSVMNYIPALTKQHEFFTTNIYVYAAQAMGEIGGQVDLFYNFKKNTFLGGKFGSDIGVNFSHYSGLKDADKVISTGGEKYFHDFNIEWKRKWSDKVNTMLVYQNVFYNKSIIEGGIYDNINTNTVVLNTIYRYKKARSFRLQLEHLATQQDKGNWAAAVAEFNFAPTWSFSVGDLYNYGVSDIHYPYIGGSYARGGSRLMLNYGRQRAGMFCGGGICRLVPATTGLSISLTTRFGN